MLTLYVAMKYDYGRPEQGYSFEHNNFYHSLLHMGHDIIYFDFMTLMQKYGRKRMNRLLLEAAWAKKPDLLFCVLFTNELDQNVIREISEGTDTITLNWFCDDHWRFDSFSRYWAPCFNWVVTTANSALPKYARLGYRNVIKSQWACNHFLYRKLDLPLLYDVTFVGQPHGNRRQVIQALRDAGINVQVWGSGWDNGRLSQEEMIRVFNQSRVNLGLSKASTPLVQARLRPSVLSQRWLSRSLDMTPFGSQVKAWGKVWLSSLRRQGARQDTVGRIVTGVKHQRPQYLEQIKARNFEVPGCGGFLLTGRADNLEEYYAPDKEVVCFDSIDDLIDKAHYYLRAEEERAAIAQAGYQRTLMEHTYVHRFTEIFKWIGLPVDSVVEGQVRLGRTEEVR